MPPVDESEPVLLRTPLCGALGCRLPLLLAGAPAGAVAAMAQAGGFGLLDAGGMPAGRLGAEIARLRDRIGRRFGVQLPAVDAGPWLDACIEQDVACVLGGMPGAAVARLHDAGILAARCVASATEACLAQDAGIDLLIVRDDPDEDPSRPWTRLEQVLAIAGTPVAACVRTDDAAGIADALRHGAQAALLGPPSLAGEPVAGRIERLATEAARRLRRMEETQVEVASPACYLTEFGLDQDARARRGRIVASLRALLDAERIVARLALRCAAESEQARELALMAIHRDAVAGCARLVRAIRGLQASPGTATGASGSAALDAIDPRERLRLLARERARAATVLRELVPQLDDPGLRDDLAAMLDAHASDLGEADEPRS